MSAKRHPLTPTVQQMIVAYVRAGGFPHVAAEAAGVPCAVFERWMRRGHAPRPKDRYRAFAEAVGQAAAQARLGAEVAILTNKPLDWLRYGPGRETAKRRGWTGAVRAAVLPRRGRREALAEPEVQALIARLLGLLEPFPEARAAIATAFEQANREGPNSPGGACR
jgi:hypothetical protein